MLRHLNEIQFPDGPPVHCKRVAHKINAPRMILVWHSVRTAEKCKHLRSRRTPGHERFDDVGYRADHIIASLLSCVGGLALSPRDTMLPRVSAVRSTISISGCNKSGRFEYGNQCVNENFLVRHLHCTPSRENHLLARTCTVWTVIINSCNCIAVAAEPRKFTNK